MGMERWCGPITLDMRGSGSITKRPGKVNSIILMEIFMTVNGLTIKQTGMEYILTSKEPDMKVNGAKTSRMAEVMKHGLKARFTMVSTS